jgi:hypothetical protein
MLLVSKKKTKSHGFINYYRNTTCSILLKQPDKHERSKTPTFVFLGVSYMPEHLGILDVCKLF